MKYPPKDGVRRLLAGMPRIKKKKLYKQQLRMSDGKFGSKKLIINDDLEQGNNDDDSKWDVAGEG
ncbi:12172_t:CDS:2 [Funneliformis geosporum]|uniref:12172_t:CDS:1 n=1 Tax=Funneliformis geosporum TaxID=1117311 RepID=A0A9W4T107_9GLOM|nr:12172_t:CDS:2 [Funneliformis geosporum]